MNNLKNVTLITLSLFITLSISAQNKWVEKGDEFFNDLDFIRAIPAYQKAVKKDSTNSYAMHQIGHAYRLIGENQKANPWYALALSVKPDSKENLYYYARTLLTVGEYDKALETYQKYNRLYPGDNRAKIYVDNPNFYHELVADSALYEVSGLPFNSNQSDYGPSLFFQYLMFTSAREREIAVKRKSTWKDTPFQDIYMIERFSDGSFGNPKIIGQPITSKWHEGSASFDKLTQDLYFTRTSFSNNQLGEDEQGITNIEIYSSHYGDDDKWGELIPSPFNNNEYSVVQPALSPDGKKLYFVSDMPGGIGDADIYVSEWEGDKWGSPKNLGEPVNTASNEKNPYISPEGVLYFSSTGHLGLGGLDIYYAEPNTTGFNAPVNLGYPINTVYDDFSFTFLNDAEMVFFFASNRPGGKGEDDIYQGIFHPKETHIEAVVIIKESLENTTIAAIMTDTKGKIIDADTLNDSGMLKLNGYSKAAPYNLIFQPIFEDEIVGNIPDIDPKTAENDLINLGTIYLGEDVPDEVVVQDELIVPDDFGIEPSSDKSKGDLYFIKLPSGEKLEYRATPAYFDFDKSDLSQKAKNELNDLIEVMKADKTIILTISGYTDSRGSKDYNIRLSERRATAALNYLVQHGIRPNRINAIGYGETHLVSGCVDGTPCTEDKYALDRRAEFKLSQVKKKKNTKLKN